MFCSHPPTTFHSLSERCWFWVWFPKKTTGDGALVTTWESMQQSSLIVTNELLYQLDDIFPTWDITHTTEQTDWRQCWCRPGSEEEFPMAVYQPYWTVDPIHIWKRRVFVDRGRNRKKGIKTSFSNLRMQCGTSLLWEWVSVTWCEELTNTFGWGST